MTTDLRAAIEALPKHKHVRLDRSTWDEFVDRAEVLALLDGAPAPGLDAKIAARLAAVYRINPVRVAALCDEHIDPSGNLLGWLREYAALADPAIVKLRGAGRG